VYKAQLVTDTYLWNYEPIDNGWFRYIVTKNKIKASFGILIIRNSADDNYFYWLHVNLNGTFIKGDRLNIEWKDLQHA
jgi:hypothetical protein